nr:hypothetical protein [Tanacetum cinerariifolium]
LQTISTSRVVMDAHKAQRTTLGAARPSQASQNDVQ